MGLLIHQCASTAALVWQGWGANTECAEGAGKGGQAAGLVKLHVSISMCMSISMSSI